MDQIPSNMIDRIEIVRGGGSSLYGSSAIGGIVNVITKIPKNDGFKLGYDYVINNKADDKVLYGNATVFSENKNTGGYLFVNKRNRDWYDFNNDNYSEIPIVKNNILELIFSSYHQKIKNLK